MNLSWYNTLSKPPLTPPSAIFAPAWGIIYSMIFLAFCIFMLTKTDKDKKSAIGFFIIQLLLNFSWSPAFFYLHNSILSLVIIILLIIFLILTINSFYKISKISAYLLIPYLVWICFAAYLNFGIMILN